MGSAGILFLFPYFCVLYAESYAKMYCRLGWFLIYAIS
nr:MAG TPA: hypothetical protein [Caudoviricetes sp.]